MSLIQRTLVIGLGAQGRRVVGKLKRAALTRYAEPRPPGLPYLTYLAVVLDTDERDDEVFLPSEEVVLSSVGMSEYVAQTPSQRARLPDGFSGEFGTGSDHDLAHSRLGASLILARHVDQVGLGVTGQLRRLFEPREWGWARVKDYSVLSTDAVNIYVVAAIDEPSGGGMLPDSLSLLQDLPFFTEREQFTFSTTAVLLSFNALADPPMPAAIAYATLAELNSEMLSMLSMSRDDPYHYRRLPANYACHLLELMDESGAILESVEDGEEMIVTWLLHIIGSTPPNLDPTGALGRLVREYGDDFPQPALPFYSSFGYAEYVVPRAALLRYFACRLGLGMVGEEGLLARVTGAEEQERLITRSWNRDILDPAELVNLDPQRLVETKISLSYGEQEIATALFSDENPKPRAMDRWQRAIEDRARIRDNAALPAYGSKVRLNLKDEVIPEIVGRIALESERLMTDRPIGGVTLAREFLQGLGVRVEEARQSLEDAREQQDDMGERLERELDRSELVGRSALVNRPRAPRILTYALITLGLCGLVWLGTAAVLGRDIAHGDMGAMLQGIATVLLRGRPLYYVLLMTLLCVGKYLWDYLVGHLRVRQRGHNLPGWGQLIYIFPGVPLFAVVCGWLFCRSLDPGSLPVELRPLLLVSPEYLQGLSRRVLFAIGTIAAICIAKFVIEYVKDLMDIRRRANAWIDAHDRLARQRAMRYRTDAAVQYYGAVEQTVAKQLSTLDGYHQKLERFGLLLESRACELDSLYAQVRSYQRLVVEDRKQADRIYQSQMSTGVAHETERFFQAPRRPFGDWLQQDEEDMFQDLAAYVRDRFHEYWQEHGVADLLATGRAATRAELERHFDWLGREARPNWSNLASEARGLALHVGIGDREDDLLRTSLMASLQTVVGVRPDVYETGNNYEVTSMTFRYDTPLWVLSSIRGYLKEYAAVADTMPHLHTRPGPFEDLVPAELTEELAALPQMRITEARAPTAVEESVPVEEEIADEVEAVGARTPVPSEAEARREWALAVLGLDPSADLGEMDDTYRRLDTALDRARRDLSDRVERLRHFAKWERRLIEGRSHYDILDVKPAREISLELVRSAYAAKKAELDEALDALKPA